MTNKQLQEIIAYWQTTAKRDYGTLLYLAKGKKYSDSLFYGHIVLEKILKAHVVLETKAHAPKIHDLIKLLQLSKCDLSDEELELLNVVNKFNIRCRYPDFKQNFYKVYNNPDNANEYLSKIKNLYKKLCRKLEQKIK